MFPSNFAVVSFLSSLFCLVVHATSTCNSSTASRYPILIDVTTESLETGLESGLFTSVDLVNAYVARILEVNATLNVITELNPDALLIAAELDAERANGTTRGPLRTYITTRLLICTFMSNMRTDGFHDCIKSREPNG